MSQNVYKISAVKSIALHQEQLFTYKLGFFFFRISLCLALFECFFVLFFLQNDKKNKKTYPSQYSHVNLTEGCTQEWNSLKQNVNIPFQNVHTSFKLPHDDKKKAAYLTKWWEKARLDRIINNTHAQNKSIWTQEAHWRGRGGDQVLKYWFCKCRMLATELTVN